MISHNLPSASTPFIDRAQELADIAQRLADPACRLLTLVGPGGMGKTRLALHSAADYLAHNKADACFVSLASVDSPGLLASTIATALNISAYSPDDPHIQIANALRDKKMLLVLDNFEVLLEGVGLLVSLLAQTSHLKLMVTSRERLNVQEEWVLPIEGMPYPAEHESEMIEDFSAVRLFTQSARRIQPAFILTNHRQAVIDICQRVEGMPLALELAASWLRVMMPEQIASQLEKNLDFLTTPLRNIPERHRSVRAVFDYSWELLSDVERTVLMKFSIFRGGFELDAAQYVADASLPILAALADKSLIRLNAVGRYDLHELLRQYSFEKLKEAGDAATTAHAHLDFILKLAEQAESSVYGPEQIRWFDRLEAEHGNIHAALSWSLESGQAEKGLQLAAALGWFWQLRLHLHEGAQWFERLLNHASKASAFIRAKAMHRASELETQLNNGARGQKLAEESLALARASNDRWNMAWALAAIGLGSMHSGMQTGPFEEALLLFRELNDLWGISHTLRRLSLFLEQAGTSYRAADLAEEALALARTAQDKSASPVLPRIKARWPGLCMRWDLPIGSMTGSSKLWRCFERACRCFGTSVTSAGSRWCWMN
jgi:predicted ATPase